MLFRVPMPHRILNAFLVVAAALVISGGAHLSSHAQEPAATEPAATEPAAQGPTTAEPNGADEAADTEKPADTEQPASPPAAPAPVAAAEPAAAPMVQAGGAQTVRFNFSNTSWKDVLLWLSEEADLSLKAERYPEGTLSFVDPSREYTVSEALDQLNRQLLDRGFAMVRRGRMLMVIDLESPLAPKYIENIAEVVTPDALDERGESDIVKTIFPLGAMTPEAADQELRQMLGPSMPMSVLPSARQVVVTDTVARLKAIRSVLEEATNAGLEVTEIVLKHRAADEVLMLARPLIGLEEDSNSNESIKIAIDPFGDRMFVAGEPSSVALFQRIVEKADKPLMLDGAQTQEVQLPELRTYPITLADPPTVYDVMSTLLAGLPDTRLSLDPASNSLIVFTRPDTHTIVQSALDKLEGKGIQVDTIQLRRLEPSAALLTINKFFGKTEENNLGPIVDGDPITGRLWIRGTAEQISQTKDLIERLEGSDALGSLGDTIRVLPYSGQNAVDLLEQAELMWENSGRKNRIRMLTPASKNSDGGFPERRLQRDDQAPQEQPPAAEPPQTAGRVIARSPFRLAVQRAAVASSPSSSEDTDTTDSDDSNSADDAARADEAGTADDAQTSSSGEPRSGADIVITFTPQGMIVASDDPLALDDFEDLLRTLSEQSSFSNQQPTVFWLKYVKAGVASSMVTAILGGDTSGGMGATGGGLLDELGGGLGMLGGLMGLGGGGGMGDSGGGPILTATGSVSIVPDDRLNALIVQANALDMQTIETILQVIDREESPEDVQTIAKPRLIPVIYNKASDVAEIVKGVFAERMATAAGGGGGGNNQPKPEDIIKALRGGGGGGRGGDQGEKSEPNKISIAVDARSNSLIVTATPQDFEEIRELVEQVDQAGAESEEITDVIALNGAVNPEVIKQALESVLGKAVDTSKTTTSGSTATTNTTNNNNNNNGSSAADIQRRIEAFRAMQGAIGGGRTGRGGGPTGGGGATGGRGGGGGGRGGR